ncbi:hypothetical protein SAM23877_6145 [Streptomyces ambofaciens ATCC 23877]|uniref:Uncharacterized protein n=1 Tax=Streptomyces ambofaciens (strain ATCC 23877 / 3486 / DSM 40053 / JCM 4204 / NBRC 12836 / NRRL B-2516) TaxID=278992 RepID=A0A0K2B1D8_STRA7|nr:phiSA1p31-related protein [Streptomyces ambofaciens]AKZ59190.1 hypothetical protein SAM23877_6145 [Streptomyces ambofaciens ATCC 23877]WNA15383.1 hypothetical protein SAMYPH_52 [Streptomyces phage Samy]
MSDVFEVGQKVRVPGEAEGEVTYGPFRSTFGSFTGYVVRVRGIERLYRESHLAAVPTLPVFAVGDTVTLTTRDSLATVEYGPFDDRDVYVVKLVDAPSDPDDVRTFTALASVMRKVETPAVAVGDRVRVTRAFAVSNWLGRVGTVTSTTERFRENLGDLHRYVVDDGSDSVYAAEVEPVTDEDTYEYNGMVYDLVAKYRDRDGDVWRLKRVNGIVRARWDGEEDPTTDSNTLATVASTWGPLTRITD